MLKQKPQKSVQDKQSGSLGFRRPILPGAFSLRLPVASPARPNLPPTPVTPNSVPRESVVLSWHRSLSSSSTLVAIDNTILPATPPPDDCYLQPGKNRFCSPGPRRSSLGSVLASGYQLHECLGAEYTIVDELGSGGFGLVIRAVRKLDGMQVAVKLMWRDRMPKDAWLHTKGWDIKHPFTTFAVPKEAYLLRKIDHPGIVSYIDLFEDDLFVYLVSRAFYRIRTSY